MFAFYKFWVFLTVHGSGRSKLNSFLQCIAKNLYNSDFCEFLGYPYMVSEMIPLQFSLF
jgi:hypothetical protein